jgi:hypothetical protein
MQYMACFMLLKKQTKYMNHEQSHPDGHSTHTPETFTIKEVAVQLGVTVQEVQNAVEIVGDDPERVREFIRRNHTETDDTNG